MARKQDKPKRKFKSLAELRTTARELPWWTKAAPTLYPHQWSWDAAFIAVGLFFSSLTENQIVSAIATFGALLLFWILNWASYSAGGIWKGVLNYLSIFQHFDDLTRGILDTTDVVYYLSFAFFGLFLTHSVIQSRRWR